MAETLGNASSEQLLLFMALPMLGVLIFGGVLTFAYVNWRNKQQMKLNSSLTSSTNPTFSAPPANGLMAAPSNSPAPMPPVASQAAPPPIFEPIEPAELNLNLDILSQRPEMEVDMMNVSKPSREPRAGLSARLGNQARPAADPILPAASQPAVAPANLPAAVVTEPVKPVAAPAPPVEPVELLRLLRHPQTGQLIIQIGGQRYTKLAEIADKEIGQYILKLAAQFLAFTNGVIVTEAGLKTVPPPKVGAAPQPVATFVAPPLAPAAAVVPAFVPPPAPDVETAFLASLRAKPATPEPAKPQRGGLFGRPKPAPEEPLLPALNLAGQINEIAQTRLRYSPLAATTRLEITSDPGGGILINVNGAFYHGPDDIPQPEVKELIRASIQEWERS